MTVPPYIAGVHFGALIEALQSTYRDLNPDKVQSAIMERAKWAKIKTAVADVLPHLDLKQTEMSLITNKIGQLNQAPHKIILKRVFESLGLDLSEADLEAWGERNAAAHGTKTEPSGHHNQIRNCKRLRLLFVRLLLAVSSATDLYLDDCTVGHPTRRLVEAVP